MNLPEDGAVEVARAYPKRCGGHGAAESLRLGLRGAFPVAYGPRQHVLMIAWMLQPSHAHSHDAVPSSEQISDMTLYGIVWLSCDPSL